MTENQAISQHKNLTLLSPNIYTRESIYNLFFVCFHESKIGNINRFHSKCFSSIHLSVYKMFSQVELMLLFL